MRHCARGGDFRPRANRGRDGAGFLSVSPGKGEDLCGTDAFWAERGEAVNGFNGGGVLLRNGSAAADTGRISTVDKGKSNAGAAAPVCVIGHGRSITLPAPI